MQDARNLQKKTITPTSLNFKEIKPKFGSTWKPFTVYEVTGNDGIKYETPDKSYYDTFTIGQAKEIEYEVVSKASPTGGRVFVTYRLVGPQRERPETQRVLDRMLQVESTILTEIRRSEKNIIRAIELHAKGVKIDPEVEELPEVPMDLDDLESGGQK